MLRSLVRFGVFLVLSGAGVPQARAHAPDGSFVHQAPSGRVLKQVSRLVNFEGFDDPKLTLGDAI